MKYSNLIEPYIYGNLSPEEEVIFERQLARDPALAEETARRFNKEMPSTPSSDFGPSSEVESEDSSASPNRLLATGLAILMLCLLWWAMRPSGNNMKEADTKTEQPAVQSEVPTR
jgi:hypothetical protein